MCRAGLVLAFLAIFTGAASRRGFAQSTTEGAIGGTVTDQTKAVVPGATVTAKNNATNTTTTAVTDASGHFTVIRLNPGTYTVDVSLSGFTPFNQGGIIVEVGRVTNMDVTISVGGQVESVSVVAQAPVINRESSDLSTNINQTSIANLPVSARRWSNYVSEHARRRPGRHVRPDQLSRNFRIAQQQHRGRRRQHAGILRRGARPHAPELLAEPRRRAGIPGHDVELLREYGRAAGGVVNAVTKSGGNKVQGEGFYYIRDNKWGAQNPFTTTIKQVDGVYQTVPFKPEDQRNQYGVSIGGPLKQNKLFYFFSFDQQRRDFPGMAVPSNPTAFLRTAERRRTGHAGIAGASARRPPTTAWRSCRA